MKILIMSPYFYPEGGGLERYAYEMAKTFKSAGHDVVVLSLTRGSSRTETLNSGIKVIRTKPNIIISNTPVGFKYVLLAMKYGKSADVIVAHTPVPFASDVAALVSSLYKKPLIVVYHTVGYNKRGFLGIVASLYSQTLEKFVFFRSSLVISVSKTVREYLLRRGCASLVIYPPLDLSESNSRCNKKNIFLFVGQLGHYHRFKNLDILIEAFSKFKRQYNVNWKLVVVGEGDLRKHYRDMAVKLGVGDSIEFAGFLDKRELNQIYCKSKVLFLPSNFESFGMVVPEAMSSGVVPVVSSNVGSGILVTSKTGFKVYTISAEKLKNIMETILMNPKEVTKKSFLSKCAVNKFKLKHLPFLKILEMLFRETNHV